MKRFTFLFVLIISAFYVVSPVFAAVDAEYCEDVNPSNGILFDPRKCCQVTVGQYKSVVDLRANTNILNEYMFDAIYKDPSLGGSGFIRPAPEYRYSFDFDYSLIPDDYWTLYNFPKANIEGFTWVTYGLAHNADGKTEDDCWSWTRNQESPVFKNDEMRGGAPMNVNECLEKLVTEEGAFTVALRYETQEGTSVSLCEQEIAVLPKTYEEYSDYEPSGEIIAIPDDGKADTNSKWVVTVKNVHVPDQWHTFLSFLSIRYSDVQLPNKMSPVYFATNGKDVSNYLDNPTTNTEDFTFESYSYPNYLLRTQSISPPTFTLRPFGTPGVYYIGLYYGYYNVYKIADAVMEVGPVGRATPTPIETPTPTPDQAACDAAIEASPDHKLTEALCNDVCAGLRQCDQFNTYELKKICANVKDLVDTEGVDEFEQCEVCVEKGNAYTAIGCLPTTVEAFFNTIVFKLGLGLAGGIALLLMLWGSFNIIISAGDPQKIQHVLEIIIAAGSGLLLVIFSIVTFQFLGYTVFRIPGFGPKYYDTEAACKAACLEDVNLCVADGEKWKCNKNEVTPTPVPNTPTPTETPILLPTPTPILYNSLAGCAGVCGRIDYCIEESGKWKCAPLPSVGEFKNKMRGIIPNNGNSVFVGTTVNTQIQFTDKTMFVDAIFKEYEYAVVVSDKLGKISDCRIVRALVGAQDEPFTQQYDLAFPDDRIDKEAYVDLYATRAHCDQLSRLTRSDDSFKKDTSIQIRWIISMNE